MLFLLGLVAATLVSADTEGYGFPISNPLAATIIGTPPEYQPDLPDRRRMRIRELRLAAEDGRQVPEVLWFARRLNYSLAYHRRKAPLIFIIAGTGGAHRGRSMDQLQRIFYQAGFHVLSLPSPTHGNFIGAASSTGMSGFIVDDAKDLYRVMEKTWAAVKDRVEVSEFFLAGFSLGAAQAAFVSKLDEGRQSFNFSRVLMINPPVSLYNSVTILDKMLEENIPGGLDNIGTWLATVVQNFAEIYREGGFIGLSGEEFLFLAYSEGNPPDDRMAALIGLAFRISAANLVFVSDIYTDSGFIKPKNLVLTPATPLGDYAKVAFRVSFLEYFRELFVPFFQARDPQLTEDKLIHAISLASIEDYLRNSEKIGLITSADEIILAPDEVEYLRDVFGARAKIYPTGGHGGNLTYRDNVEYMVRFFKGPRGAAAP